MARCRYCKMDSVDLKWENTQPNDNLPPKWELFFQGKKHNCQQNKPKEPERFVRCTNPLCEDLGKQFNVKNWEQHKTKKHTQRTLD